MKFKISILIIASLYVLFFGFQQYIAAKAQNLAVLTETRQCIKEFSSDEAFNSCKDRAYNQRILLGHIIKW